MGFPAEFRAGTTVSWRNAAGVDGLGQPVSSQGGWMLTTYLRNATAGLGLSVVGSADGEGWLSTISAATSAGLTAGEWSWGARATLAGQAVMIAEGMTVILPALDYSGTADGLDGRSQARRDLDAVQAAIRTLISGGAVSRYSIGGRSLERYSLAELTARESQLKGIVARENAAERIAAGLGDPRNVYVRFG